MNKEDLKKLIRELVEEELDEMTGTGAVAGYSTPNAFQGGSGDASRKKKITARSIPGGKIVGDIDEDSEVMEMIRRTLGESRYHNFRNSDLMKNHAKISYSIREAKRALREVDYLMSICNRLKTESGVDQSQLWRRSKIDLKEIHRQLKGLARKFTQIGK